MPGRYSVRLDPIVKSKAVRSYSSLSFSIVAIAIFGIFAIKPTVQNIVDLQKQIDTQKSTLKALQDKSNKLAQAVNNYNSIPDDTKLKLFTLLPNTPNPTCLIDGLNGLISSNQTQTQGLQFQPFDLKGNSKCALDSSDLSIIEKNSTTASTLSEVPFALNVTADFPHLSNFINSLNSSVRLVRIDTALFSKNGENPLVLSISGKAYYYK